MTTYAVPPELRDRALALRGAGDNEKWLAGDLLSDSSAEAPPGHRTETVKILAGDLGIGYSTARKWQRCAETYQNGQREQYADAMTFECYAEAMYDDNPMALLAWAVESADEHGGVISPVDRLRVERRKRANGAELSALEEYRRALVRLASAADTARRLAAKAGITSRHLAEIVGAVEDLEKQAERKA